MYVVQDAVLRPIASAVLKLVGGHYGVCGWDVEVQASYNTFAEGYEGGSKQLWEYLWEETDLPLWILSNAITCLRILAGIVIEPRHEIYLALREVTLVSRWSWVVYLACPRLCADGRAEAFHSANGSW